MKELHEFRIYNRYAHLLLKTDEGTKLGIYRVIEISRNDPKFDKIKILAEQIRKEHNDFFFLYSNIKRQYTKQELDNATLLHLKIINTFDPAGEECGTKYDESTACEICGSDRKQVGPLKLKKGSMQKTDISWTIAGEIVVSNNFVKSLTRYD